MTCERFHGGENASDGRNCQILFAKGGGIWQGCAPMKYKTSQELGITEQERDALIKVKEFLKKLSPPKNYASRVNHEDDELETPGEARFNMNREVARYDCGTGCCIGGWMSLYMQGVPLRRNVVLTQEQVNAARRYVINRPDELNDLFYPNRIDYDAITPADAIAQIEQFLRTGEATW